MWLAVIFCLLHIGLMFALDMKMLWAFYLQLIYINLEGPHYFLKGCSEVYILVLFLNGLKRFRLFGYNKSSTSLNFTTTHIVGR